MKRWIAKTEISRFYSVFQFDKSFVCGNIENNLARRKILARGK